MIVFLYLFKESIFFYNMLVLSMVCGLPRKAKHLNISFSCVKMCSCYLGKWKQPEGFHSGITIYNSASNRKVPLVLRIRNTVTWYMCGPTVYDEAHIGHASCYIKFDIIRRILESLFNVKVKLLMGITDIDDKIIKKAKETGLSVQQISKRYESSFFDDLCTMRVNPPSAISRVTDNIPQIISFCQKLIDKDFAYVTEKGNVYFKVIKSTSADVLNEMYEESELIDTMKQDKRDFVLWKASKENEPYWSSPWGNGRPGWHIECSVMASNVFGSCVDLHSGGYDLLFPHHTNEKSQSEAYHSCSQWVNYWLHSGLLHVGEDVKMSKSIKNTITIKEFLNENSVNDFRIFCLQSPLRKNMSYCEETLVGAKGLHKKFHHFINELDCYINEEVIVSLKNEHEVILKLEKTKEQVLALFADDFNTSSALLHLVAFIDFFNENVVYCDHFEKKCECLPTIASCHHYMDGILETLGVEIVSKKRLPRDFVDYMDAVVELRNQVRVYALCFTDADLNTSSDFENLSELYYIRMKSVDYAQLKVQNVKETYQDVEVFVNHVMEFTSLFTDNPESTKEEKKRRAPLLKYCDDLRTALDGKGVAIKDRKLASTWIPLISLLS